MPDKPIYIELLDKEGNCCGEKEKFALHRMPVPLHMAISVLIFDGDKVLLQKRADSKRTWPGFWSNTVCSHPFPKESYLNAAKRRLKEEMGFVAPLKEKFRFNYKARYNKTWGENEHDVVFVGNYTGYIKPNTNEVTGYKWMRLDDLKKDIKSNPDRYTPWFKIILKKLGI